MRALLLEEPYASRLTFEVYAWDTDRGRAAHKAYGFGVDRHGLVVLSLTGQPLAVRPGHDYGRAEIQADFDRVLAR